MNYTRKNLSDTQVVLNVTLEADDLTPIKRKTLGRLAKKIKVAGFRPGKVPASVAEKNLDQSTLNMEVAEDAVNAYAINVLQAEDLQPLDRPKVELSKYVPNQSLEFKADVQILPAIKLGDYKNLKAKKEPIKVSAKDVNDVIERMRLGMAEKKEVQRAAKLGDELIIDFNGTDKDGKEVAGASSREYPLVLGSNSLIPGFEEGLVGKKASQH